MEKGKDIGEKYISFQVANNRWDQTLLSECCLHNKILQHFLNDTEVEYTKIYIKHKHFSDPC